MRSTFDGLRPLRCAVLALLTLAAPASAQWTQVADVPTTELFSVWAGGDTIVAGADTAAYISTNAGASWLRSSNPSAAVAPIEAARIRNGRLYVGTFGQGAFVSDDLGATWQAFNQGLVGGFLDTQLDLVDFQIRADSLYGATAGAGMYVRHLSAGGTWQPFGSVFEPYQASNVNSLALGGGRLLALAGANGMVFVRDPGDAEWGISNLDNIGIHAGLTSQTAAWTGTGWVVGTNFGLFRSVAGVEPWTRSDPGLGALDWTTFATAGRHLFVAFDIVNAAVIEESDDDGASWQNEEFLPDVFVEKMAVSGGNLYAARGDGLWRRPLGIASVTGGGAAARPRLALAGPQPCRDQARLRFELPEAGSASLAIVDVLGRAADDRIEGRWSAGPHEVSLDTRRLSPGVYLALLTAGGTRSALRLVHVR